MVLCFEDLFLTRYTNQCYVQFKIGVPVWIPPIESALNYNLHRLRISIYYSPMLNAWYQGPLALNV